MKPSDIHLGDWKRLLIGDAPWTFLFEVLLRSTIMYVVLIAALRVLGKRLGGQLTILEMGVMITLGAIVSPAMTGRDRGLLVALVLLLCILLFQRLMGRLGLASNRFERAAQGDTTLLVQDGRMEVGALDHASLSREALYATLREKGFFHLGQLERVYLEACGMYTFYRAQPPRPGLSVYDDADREALDRVDVAPERVACRCCGQVVEQHASSSRCPGCRRQEWAVAVASRAGA